MSISKRAVSRRTFLGGTAAVSAASFFGLTPAVNFVRAAEECGTRPPGAKFTVGAMGKAMDVFWNLTGQTMAKFLEPLGGEVILKIPQQQDVPKQREFIEGFLAEGVDVILFGASDPEAFTDLVGQAIDQKIPVGCWEADAAPSGRLVYVGGVDAPYGAKVAQAMVDKLGGQGKVVIMQGSATATNARDRGDAMEKTLTEGGCEVVTRVFDDEDPNYSLEQAEQLIASTPDLAGFTTIYGYHPEVTGQAVQNAGKKGEIMISSCDPFGEGYKYIQDGTIFKAFNHTPFTMGAVAAMWAYNMLTFGPEHTWALNQIDATLPPAERKIVMPDIEVTPENADAYIQHQLDLEEGLWGFECEELS